MEYSIKADRSTTLCVALHFTVLCHPENHSTLALHSQEEPFHTINILASVSLQAAKQSWELNVSHWH